MHINQYKKIASLKISDTSDISVELVILICKNISKSNLQLAHITIGHLT
jgi:hypothetical protein